MEKASNDTKKQFVATTYISTGKTLNESLGRVGVHLSLDIEHHKIHLEASKIDIASKIYCKALDDWKGGDLSIEKLKENLASIRKEKTDLESQEVYFASQLAVKEKLIEDKQVVIKKQQQADDEAWEKEKIQATIRAQARKIYIAEVPEKLQGYDHFHNWLENYLRNKAQTDSTKPSDTSDFPQDNTSDE